MIFGNSNELAEFIDCLLNAERQKDILQILDT
jgi:hypothetical protein